MRVIFIGRGGGGERGGGGRADEVIPRATFDGRHIVAGSEKELGKGVVHGAVRPLVTSNQGPMIQDVIPRRNHPERRFVRLRVPGGRGEKKRR